MKITLRAFCLFLAGIVLALVVAFQFFPERRDSSFNAVQEEIAPSVDYRAHSTPGGEVTPVPRKTQRIAVQAFKATEAEIQHFSQPTPVARIKSADETQRETLKQFAELGMDTVSMEETYNTINMFISSLSPDETIYCLRLCANGDEAALDKFRQERGFYYPDEARRFLPMWKKRTSKRAPPAANTTTQRVQSDPSPHDDARIGESEVERSYPHSSQITATETMSNPQELQHPEPIPLTPKSFSPVQEIEQYIPENTLQRGESNLPRNKTNLDDWLKTNPEPPATREHPRNNQPSRHSPHDDDTRKH